MVKVTFDVAEIIDREMKDCGNGTHILVPTRLRGKKVKLIVLEEKK